MEYGIVTYTRLPKTLRSQLEQIASERGEHISTVLRDAARQYVEAHSSKTPTAPAPTKKARQSRLATARASN